MIHEIGEQGMLLFKKMFSSADKVTGCLITGLSAIFAPTYIAILAISFFIVLDAIYGYKVSRKYGFKKFESNKAWKTLNKLFEAGLLVICANKIDVYVVVSLNLHAVEFVSGAICFVEFISLLESLSELHPKGPWRILHNIIKAKGEKYLDVVIPDNADLNGNDDELNNIKNNNKLVDKKL